MTSSRRALLTSFAALSLLAAASPASAQRNAQDVAQARVLYGEGMELKTKGDMKGALEKFKGAHALGNTPLTGIELCKAHQALHQPVEAREACLSVGRIGPIPEESQRSKDARVEAAKVAEEEKPKMGSIKVVLKGVPAGMTPSVSIDGVQLKEAALGTARPVDPGPHVILASVGGGDQTKASFETKEGENREVEVPVVAPAKPVTPTTPQQGQPTGPGPQPEKKTNVLAATGIGVGSAAVLVGLIAGGVALSKTGDLSDNCTGKICGREDWDTRDSASTWAAVSTVSFIVGAVALGAGLVGLAVGPSKSGANTNARQPSKLGFTFRGLDGTF